MPKSYWALTFSLRKGAKSQNINKQTLGVRSKFYRRLIYLTMGKNMCPAPRCSHSLTVDISFWSIFWLSMIRTSDNSWC